MKVYTATIDHKHGTNFYVGLSEDNVRKQVADYCREWWDDEMEDYDMPETDVDVIWIYFGEPAKGMYESVTYGETDLEFPGTPFKVLSKAEADQKMELEYIETESGFHIGLDSTYMDQVEDFKIILPTGEVIDTSKI